MVSSYAIDDGTRLLLFDPLAPPSLEAAGFKEVSHPTLRRVVMRIEF